MGSLAPWRLQKEKTHLIGGPAEKLRFGEALLFTRDGSWVDQPLCFAGPAGLLAFDAGETADFEKTADFGASGIEKSGSLLSGEPAGIGLGHCGFSSEDELGGDIHFNGSVPC